MQSKIINLLPEALRARVINESREELEKSGVVRQITDPNPDDIKRDIEQWAASHKKVNN